MILTVTPFISNYWFVQRNILDFRSQFEETRVNNAFRKTYKLLSKNNEESLSNVNSLMAVFLT